MYELTLTSGERQAFDWVGHRYASSGDKMAFLICEGMPPDAEWADDGDITFSIPEHVAWEMAELVEQDDSPFPCFSGELAEKMQDFLDNIV